MADIIIKTENIEKTLDNIIDRLDKLESSLSKIDIKELREIEKELGALDTKMLKDIVSRLDDAESEIESLTSDMDERPDESRVEELIDDAIGDLRIERS